LLKKKKLAEEERKAEEKSKAQEEKVRKENLKQERQAEEINHSIYEEALAYEASVESGEEPSAFFGGRKNEQIKQIKNFLKQNIPYEQWCLNRDVGSNLSGTHKDQLSKEVTEVFPGLHISSFLTLPENSFSKHDIKTVIELSDNIHDLKNTKVLHINLSKVAKALDDTFSIVADEVVNAKKQDHAVLISCEETTGLAATICMAYLIKYEGWNVKTAAYIIKERRPNIVLDQTMIVQLEAWKHQLWKQKLFENMFHLFVSWIPLLLLIGVFVFLLRMYQEEVERIYMEDKQTPEYEYFDILKWP